MKTGSSSSEGFLNNSLLATEIFIDFLVSNNVVTPSGCRAAHRASLPGHSVQHHTQEPQQAEVPGHGKERPRHPGQEGRPRHDGRRAGHAPHPRLLRGAGPQGPGGEATHFHDGQDGEMYHVR